MQTDDNRKYLKQDRKFNAYKKIIFFFVVYSVAQQ